MILNRIRDICFICRRRCDEVVTNKVIKTFMSLNECVGNTGSGSRVGICDRHEGLSIT